MFGKRWRVDRSARSPGGVDVFRTCAIPPTGAFGFGFGNSVCDQSTDARNGRNQYLRRVDRLALHTPNYVVPQPLHLPRLRHATVERLDGPAGADGCNAARADVHLLSTSGG